MEKVTVESEDVADGEAIPKLPKGRSAEPVLAVLRDAMVGGESRCCSVGRQARRLNGGASHFILRCTGCGERF